MRKTYDFSNATRNPYAKQLQKQITMYRDFTHPRLDVVSQIGPFKSLIDGYALSDAIRKRVEAADVLLLPSSGHAGEEVLYFPAGTPELMSLLEAELPNLMIEAAVEEETYQELALHGELVILATTACKKVVFPTLVKALSLFLEKRLGRKKFETGSCRARLIVEKTRDGNYLEFNYEGPAPLFQKQLEETFQRLDLIIPDPPSVQRFAEQDEDETQRKIEDRSARLESRQSRPKQTPKPPEN